MWQKLNMPTRLNLTVIRCTDIDASFEFYRLTGLEFEKHRHGTGPEHYAASDGFWTFELYPASCFGQVSGELLDSHRFYGRFVR